MRRLHVPGYQTSKFVSGWSYLEKLGLDLLTSIESLSWMTELVFSASRLQKLTLGRLRINVNDDSSKLLFDQLSAAERLPALRESSISFTTLKGPALTRFVLRLGHSLCTLSLARVKIMSGTLTAFFREMRSNFPLLEHISVEWLREPKIPAAANALSWLDAKDIEILERTGRGFKLKYVKYPSRPSVYGAKYCGPGIDKALDVLARATAVIPRFENVVKQGSTSQ